MNNCYVVPEIVVVEDPGLLFMCLPDFLFDRIGFQSAINFMFVENVIITFLVFVFAVRD